MRDARFLPLTADEITAAADIVRAAVQRPESIRFAALYAHEPDKRALRDGIAPNREARALLVDRADGTSWDMIVDLVALSVVRSEKVLAGASPVLTEEFMTIGARIKEDPRYQAALAKRGITDLTLVQIDPWAVSNVPEVNIYIQWPTLQFGVLCPALRGRQRLRASHRGRRGNRRPDDQRGRAPSNRHSAAHDHPA